jgi:hypothetical protein
MQFPLATDRRKAGLLAPWKDGTCDIAISSFRAKPSRPTTAGDSVDRGYRDTTCNQAGKGDPAGQRVQVNVGIRNCMRLPFFIASTAVRQQ